MSLTNAQVQIIARSEPFAASIREALRLIAEMSPARWMSIRHRHRSRVVTRNKQRRSW